MDQLLINILYVLLFTLIGAIFAASEMALVTLRDTQIDALAEKSGAGRKIKELTEDSNRFLSAVQVGVTLAGFFSASFGASAIAPMIAPWFESWGMSAGAASTTSFIVTTLVISYISIVFGELVPKRLAMQSAETISLIVAYPLSWITALLRPVIWFLGVSVNVVLRILGRNPEEKREDMDAEELRSYVAGYEAIPETERSMVVDLLSVGERSVEEIMTPRTEIHFLDADLSIEDAQQMVNELEHSRYPVRDNGSDDEILGFIHIRDLIVPGENVRRVRDLVRPVQFFPVGKAVLSALTEMRSNNSHMAIVVDEYGGTDGLVTVEDVVEEFVGEIQDEYDREEDVVSRAEVGGEVSGLMGRAEVAKYLHTELPEGPFDTLAGYMVDQLDRMPQAGDSTELGDLVLTVSVLDGRRIDRIRVRRRVEDPEDPTSGEDH